MGKEAGRAKQLGKKFEAEHSSNNAFVKHHQAMDMSMGMKAANLEEKYMKFDACMISDGEHAQAFARDLTKGIDEKAFPVK